MSCVLILTRAASPVAFTCSFTSPTARLKSIVGSWPITKEMPDWMRSEKPSFTALMSYCPTGSAVSS